MRAREPDRVDSVERDGLTIGYELFEGPSGATVTFVCPPIDPIVDGRVWKAQVPFLARHGRVVVIDPRGNGRSDRPTDPAAYADEQFAADTVAVMDAVRVERAYLVGLCSSAWFACLTAAQHPDRVSGLVAINPFVPHLVPPYAYRAQHPFDVVPDTDVGWAKHTASYWNRDYRGFLEFFADQILPEPHSTKQIEDFLAWGWDNSVEAQTAREHAPSAVTDAAGARAVLARISCPVLVIHGDSDRCQPAARAEVLAELTGAERLLLHGAGHLPQAREPVQVNVAIRDFVRRHEPGLAQRRRQWTRPGNRLKRVLYLSSAIGLGHARRDLAIATSMREQVPGLQIDWLTQHPVTAFLQRHGERVHPAAALLANESAHIETLAGDHDLRVFEAFRQMDEILVANFGVFAELTEQTDYDLWVGDEAWDVDYFLHENPELKTTAYVWATDFVGFLPMPAGGEREGVLTADYNAEMLEQIDRLPRIRDRALFIGNPTDAVDRSFGPGLPNIRDWTAAHYDFTGYVQRPAGPVSRAEFGFGPRERVCVVSVGGSGVGTALLRRCAEAFPIAAARIPGLRMILVTGPRIDPRLFADVPGVEVRGEVPDLARMLAAADIAVVQGGLATTMELTAAGTPFLYVPLQHHFEQNIHVHHRLENYGAGRCLDWASLTPDSLAAALAAELATPRKPRPVETDGPVRAARLMAELL